MEVPTLLDGYDLAIGYEPNAKKGVVEYLLGRPWMELIQRGYLVQVNPDFYRISEDGTAALNSTAMLLISRSALEAVKLLHPDLAEAERDFREGRFEDAIPLQIALIEVTEVATANKSLTLTASFRSGGSSAPIQAFDPEFANLAALYREALISNTPVYRYLCFYKILEVSRKRRERLGHKLKKQYQPKRDGEIIPSTAEEQIAWLNAIFIGPQTWEQLTLNQIFPPEVRGKKLTALFDTQLRPLRDRIAHGILDSGEYLHVDDLAAIREITKWLPFLRCAARRTLKNDFPDHYLPYLSEDGSVAHPSG